MKPEPSLASKGSGTNLSNSSMAMNEAAETNSATTNGLLSGTKSCLPADPDGVAANARKRAEREERDQDFKRSKYVSSVSLSRTDDIYMVESDESHKFSGMVKLMERTVFSPLLSLNQ